MRLKRGIGDHTDRLPELEASLTLKVQELDESDDRVRDMYKNNAKLEKKVAKLTRQLAAAETAANTATNRTIAVPVVPMGPPPVLLSKALSRIRQRRHLASPYDRSMYWSQRRRSDRNAAEKETGTKNRYQRIVSSCFHPPKRQRSLSSGRLSPLNAVAPMRSAHEKIKTSSPIQICHRAGRSR